MKKTILVLALTAAFATALPVVAQAPAPEAPSFTPTATFSLSAQAVALPGGKNTVAATLLGGTFQITDHFALRQTNLLAQAGDMTGYYGGFEYALPSLSKRLNAVSQFDASHLQFYVTGSAGVDRASINGADIKQHYSFLGGGGARYDPTGSGHFTMQLFEIQYLKAPGYANSTAIVSTGLKLGF